MSASEAATSSNNPAAESKDVEANGATKDGQGKAENPSDSAQEAPVVKGTEAEDEKSAESTTNGKSDGADKASADEPTGDRRDRDNKKSYSDRKHGGRNDRNDRNGNRRSKGFNDRKAKNAEFENLPETDDADAIRQQVEFYFSSQNLSTDKHLFMEMGGPKNRPVSIKHIHSFKRMRHFTPYSAIVNALKESDQLVVVEDGDYFGKGNEGVKRKDPITIPGYDEEKDTNIPLEDLFIRLFRSSQNSMDKSIYAKNFGDEATVGQIELETFFKSYGAVMVRKRRDQVTGDWKGSVFVEFDTEESQQEFLKLDPKPQFRGNDLEIMSKKDYSAMKCEQKGIQPSWMQDDPGNTRREFRGSGGGRGRGRGRGQRGGGGRYGRDRDDRRDHRRRNDSRSRSGSRSRSPHQRRRRDRDEKRSRSRSSSGDRDDWNNRRDKFQKSDGYRNKDRRGDRRDRDRDYGKSSRSGRDRRDRDREERKEPERDEHGVPVVKDTRDLKRKADDENRENSPKKSKVEIAEDA